MLSGWELAERELGPDTMLDVAQGLARANGRDPLSHAQHVSPALLIMVAACSNEPSHVLNTRTASDSSKKKMATDRRPKACLSRCCLTCKQWRQNVGVAVVERTVAGGDHHRFSDVGSLPSPCTVRICACMIGSPPSAHKLSVTLDWANEAGDKEIGTSL